MSTADPKPEGLAPEMADARARKVRILQGLQGRELQQAIFDPGLWADLLEEAGSGGEDALVTPGVIAAIEQARGQRLGGDSLGLFFSTDDVLIVPGLMGSELVDVSGERGLLWIDPKLLRGDTTELESLKLGKYEKGRREDGPVRVQANGAIPLLYGILKFDLEARRYSVRIFGVDWRKDLEESAIALARVIRSRSDQRFRPLHLIAHSQGSLVARRAIQLLGADLAPRLVKTLILLGPATGGSFSAVTALTGNHGLLETVRRYGIVLPDGFEETLQSMSGLYQLIPWKSEPVANWAVNEKLSRAVDAAKAGGDAGKSRGRKMNRPLDWVEKFSREIKSAGFWPNGIDRDRLRAFFGWGDKIQAGFINDRTSIILGDRPTVGGVKKAGKFFVADPDYETTGDGTMPDALALVGGVTRVYKARGAEHMMLPATASVIAAVRDILADRSPRVEPFALGLGRPETPFPFLMTPRTEPGPATGAGKASRARAVGPARRVPALSPITVGSRAILAPRMAGEGFPPAFRRLRVFSFDPLMANELDALGTEQITLELPWEFADGNQLQPGPVGEYVEVVDCDPASGCVYPPVDLNHPHILAQDGVPVSEGDPRFHQQMAYAVAMNTIRYFELALGRKALWSPHLPRDADGKVKASHLEMSFERQAEVEFVQRLRIYPHAFLQANAYYNPEKKALLFGYFPALGQDGDRNLPGGTVFTCLSHDVVAHETTHALLDGMHRYFVEPSNPDVFAFHEAFADIVALFQHFTHREVLLAELGKARGGVGNESKLGILAAQFGEATGSRGALRQYLGRKDPEHGNQWRPIEPDPSAIRRVTEPHERGALLVAALFRAFTNIYESRVGDLRRIATGGTGLLPEGALHPDLLARMADEAAKSAEHMLNVCIRALDYVPPVDVSFGVYLRAMITADYDLIPEDARHYRAAIVSAFRDWGIYPCDVRSLSVDNLLWSEPTIGAHPDLREFLKEIPPDEWDLNSDRRMAYEGMKRNAMLFHQWLGDSDFVSVDEFESLGLIRDAKGARSVRLDRRGKPAFEVHSLRPCRRIGPDHQPRTEFVVEVVQKRMGFFDKAVQDEEDAGKIPAGSRPADFPYRGGCTLLIDPKEGRIRYCIQKSIRDRDRLEHERQFRLGEFGDGVGSPYIDAPGRPRNPFAFLHRG